MIIFLTGFSCSGKSTLAKSLEATFFNCTVFSASTLLREMARKLGYARGRYWLEAVGDIVALESVYDEMQELVRKSPSEHIIVDGLYCKAALSKPAFKESRRAVIAVHAGLNLRVERTMSRNAMGRLEAETELAFIDGFKCAVGMCEVLQIADLHLDGSSSVITASQSLIQALMLQGNGLE